MADAWEEAAKKYTAKPGTAADSKQTGSVWDTVNLNPGSPSEAVGRFASNMAEAVNPVPGIRAIASDPQGLKHGIEENVFRPQVEQFGKAADAAQGKGEFAGMGPIGRASETFGHGLAGALPLAGPAAANAGDQIGSGDVAGGLGSAAGLLATTGVPTDNPAKAFRSGSVRSIGLPDAVPAIGRGLQHAAEPVMENALGIRNVDRAPGGKMPGRAALDMTRGFRPETIEKSARNAMGEQTAARSAAMAASPNARPSLRPALDEIEAAQNKGAAGNSDMSHLAPMQDQLTTPKPGFAGATQGSPLKISELQNPDNFLALRQRFGNDFTKFDHARPLPSETMNVGNRAYHQLTDEFHRAVPGTEEPDTNISNLAPVAESAAARKLNAPPLQRMVARFAPHTGAMAGMIAGGMTHGIPGAIAGGVIPEILASPTVQAAAARGINGAGRAVASPITPRLIQGAQLAKPLRSQQ